MALSEETGGPPDAEELHDYAVKASACVEKLATGMAQAQADPPTVQAMEKIAEVLRQVATGLAKGMKEQEAEPAHTMDSAMQETMAERAASANAQQPPPAE